MPPPRPGDDAPTVIIRREPGRRRGLHVAAAASIVVAVAASLLLSPHAMSPAPRVADEAAIAADQPAVLTVFRLAARPAIVVLDFPTLAEQGEMLDRVAALVEKRGLPHDRDLDDAALDRAIRADGDTPDTWYDGHDYRAADITRFFRLADSQGLTLNPGELRLRRLAAAWAHGAAGFGAVITLPAVDPAHGIDPAVRRVILHHEISHGFYFTDAHYASGVTLVWHDVMTAEERRAWSAYLERQEYDPTLADLMANEMQAYLEYTPEGPFFDAARTGIAPERMVTIRDALRAIAPAGLRPASP